MEVAPPTRIVKVQENQGEWVEVPFDKLSAGQRFMMYELDGTSVGCFTATSDPYVNNHIWTIDVADE